MDWIECFLSLITLVETIPEAQFSTWHLGLSFCLVLLVKQVWNCHQHPDQFTLLCLPWHRHLESWGPEVKTQIFIFPKSQQGKALDKRKRKPPTNIGYTIIQSMTSQFTVTFHFLLQKHDYVFCLGWPLRSERNFWTMLYGLTPSSLPCAPSGINKLSPLSLPVFSIVFSFLLPQPPFFYSLTLLTQPMWQFFLMVSGERQMSYCSFFSRFIITFQ